MAAEFQAMSRIPFRPLSYENVDLAFDKELIADYEKGNLYLKDAHGNIIDLTKSIAQLLTQDQTFVENLTVNVIGPDGKEIEVRIDEHLAEITKQITDMQKVVDAITGKDGADGADGEIKVIIKPGQIIQDTNHQFINSTQFTELTNKVSIDDVIITIPASGWSGAGPYTQTVACVGAKTNMPRPTLDINHTDSETFDNAKKADEEWTKIYRAKTGENTLTIYATEKPSVDLSAVVQLKITGLTANTEIKTS